MQVFVTSPWVPIEWIAAHGLEPCGAWSVAADQTAAVPEGVCAFARAMSELAQAQPEAAVIFTTACDQMRRAADAVTSHPSPSTFLFNLPATWQTPAARRLYRSEVQRLGGFLESSGGRAPTDAQLASVIRDYESLRTALRRFIPQNSARQEAETLIGFFKLEASPNSKPAFRRCARAGVPLALVGGPLLPSQWPLFDAIESAGGHVALNASEPGGRNLLPPMPNLATNRDPLSALADHYFDHIVDVFQRPNSRLYEWLSVRLKQRGVRGIILWVHVGCDLWRAEAASLRDAFGLPLLVLESRALRAGTLREQNRLAAFIESLQ